MIIKDFVNDLYLKWWGQNYDWAEHSLFYMIYYKQALPGQNTYTAITYQLPRNYPIVKRHYEDCQQSLNKANDSYDDYPKFLEENSLQKDHSLSRITEDSINIIQTIDNTDKALFL